MWYGLGRFFIEGLRQDSLIIPGTGLRVSQVVALVSVLTAVVLLIVFRNKTSLSGCGAKDVMAMNAVVDEIPASEETEDKEDETSTIFGDLPFEELITDTSASGKKEETDEENEGESVSSESLQTTEEEESRTIDVKADSNVTEEKSELQQEEAAEEHKEEEKENGNKN